MLSSIPIIRLQTKSALPGRAKARYFIRKKRR